VLAPQQRHLPPQGDHQSLEVLGDPNYRVAAAASALKQAARLCPDHAPASEEAAANQAVAMELRSAWGPALLQSSQIDRLTQGRNRAEAKESNRQQPINDANANDGNALANKTI